MPNIDRIIDAELHRVRLIGCVVNIFDDECEESDDLEEYKAELTEKFYQYH